MSDHRGQNFGRHSGGSRPHAPHRGGRDQPSPPDTTLVSLLNGISFDRPAKELFDERAQTIARILSGGNTNKASQIRRFYDTIIRWADQFPHAADGPEDADRFERDLPFIRMICAHGAYAQTRGHVDENFVAFLQGCIRKIERPAHLRLFRSLFEAVIGFMPKQD